MAQPQPLSSDDPRIIDPAEAFFSKNLYPLIIAIIAVLALGCAATWWWIQKQTKEDEAGRLYFTAQSPEELQKIVQSYPQAPAAALALVDLAQKEISSGNYTAALGLYQQFLKDFSRHPAASSVELAQAVILENAGKTEEARSAYQQMLSARPPHAFVGPASIGLARIYLKENNLLAARQTLSDFISTNEESGGANQAREMLNSLPPAQK